MFDTPYFSSITNQANYFRGKLVSAIVDGDYPPHYQDVIKLDSEDVGLNSTVNYLSLFWNNKEYYYFINNIDYINEGMLAFTITMDVIQTYMFNINFMQSHIIRSTISRWNREGDNYVINRNYIRENVSKESMLPQTLNNLNDEIAFLIIGSTVKLETSSTVFNDMRYSKKHHDPTLYYYIYPLIPAKYDSYTIYSSDESILYFGYRVIRELLEQPGIVSANFIPYNPIYNTISYEIDNEQDIITFNVPIGNRINYIVDEDDSKKITLITLQNQIIPKLTYEIPIKTEYASTFIRNTAYRQGFASKYTPQMIDENYMQIEFGEKIGTTSFPLSKLVTEYNHLTGKIITDCASGNRIINMYGDDTENDIYFTTLKNTTDESYPLFNDAWKTYLSQNKATLTSGVALAKKNTVFNGVRGILSGLGGVYIGAHNETISSGYVRNDYYEDGYEIKESTRRHEYNNYNNTVSNAQMMQGGMASGFAIAEAEKGLYNIRQNLKITKENLEFTPDTINYGNSASADILAEANDIIYKISYVKDFEEAHKLLEGYGYKVNLTTNNDNLFETLNIRYYYNIIECDKLEIYLTNVINSQDTLQEIKDRFFNGLRLWNVWETQSDIGDSLYVYDNVEKDFIGG